MPEFRDAANRTWPIVFTPQIRSRLSHATGAELANAVGIVELAALAYRPDLLREALWQFCYVDAMDLRIGRDAFVDSLDEASLRSGFQALAEAFAVEAFGDKAGPALGSIANAASRLKAILDRPIACDDLAA